MGAIKITAINRNIGAFSQQYRIEYRLEGEVNWMAGPTLNYNQAITSMPISIPIPDIWIDSNVEVRVATICGTTVTNSGITTILIETQPC